MSVKNVVLCCHPNAFIIRIAGVLLGTYTGYAFSKKLIVGPSLKDRNVQLIDLLNINLKEPALYSVPLTIRGLGGEAESINMAELAGIDEYTRYAANIVVADLWAATLEYVGPLYAVLQGAAGFIVVSRTLYSLAQLLRPVLQVPRALGIQDLNNLRNDIRDVMNDGNQAIRNLRDAVQGNNEISINAANDLQQLSNTFVSNTEITQGGLNKIANDILNKLERFGAHNQDVANGIIESLEAIKQQLQKQGGDVSDISDKIDKARFILDENVMIIPRSNIQVQEQLLVPRGSSTINIMNEPTPVPFQPINYESVEINRENTNIYNNINTALREVETAEKVRKDWMRKQDELYKQLSDMKKKNIEETNKQQNNELIEQIRPQEIDTQAQSNRLREAFLSRTQAILDEFNELNQYIYDNFPASLYDITGFYHGNSGPSILNINIQYIRNLLQNGSANYGEYIDLKKIGKFAVKILDKGTKQLYKDKSAPINDKLLRIQDKLIQVVSFILLTIQRGKLTEAKNL